MGASRDLIDAATLAPSAFETWGNEVSSRADGSGAVSLTAEGGVGDDSTDNTTVFNNCLTKAGRDGKVVIDKSGIYRVSGADLDLSRAGFTIEGANGIFAGIRQVTANTDLFNLVPDTTYDYSNAIGITFRNLRLYGPSGGTSGWGIMTDTASGTYQGARLTIDQVQIEGFSGGGVRLHRFDNCFVRNLFLKSMPEGWYSEGNANSIHLINCGASTITNTAYRFGEGRGVTFQPADLINSGKMIQVDSGGQVVVIGGNFESCTGSNGFIDIAANGQLVGIGQRFLKGTVETPGYRVDLAKLIVIDSGMDGFTTAPLVKKVNDTAAVFVFRSSGLSGTERTVQTTDAALSTIAHAPFPSRIDNSVPAAAVGYRGLVLHKVVRDSTSAEDALYWYGKDRSGGSDVYTQRVMTNVIEGTGTPEGAVTARIGTLYARRDGGTGTSLYVKETGTGATGWVAK